MRHRTVGWAPRFKANVTLRLVMERVRRCLLVLLLQHSVRTLEGSDSVGTTTYCRGVRAFLASCSAAWRASGAALERLTAIELGSSDTLRRMAD